MKIKRQRKSKVIDTGRTEKNKNTTARYNENPGPDDD